MMHVSGSSGDGWVCEFMAAITGSYILRRPKYLLVIRIWY
jgi:hypothetical protein